MKLLPCLHGTFTCYDKPWKETLLQLGITPDSPWTKIQVGTQVSRSKRVNCFLVEKNNKKAFFKTYQLHDKFWEFFLRPSKCLTEVRNYLIMDKIGVPCPKVIAYGERRNFASLHENFIITKAIEDAEDLSNFAEKWHTINDLCEKNKIYRELSKEVLKQTLLAHQNNFFHFDLHWRNILIKKDAQGNWLSFWIDSPRGRSMTFNSRRGQIVDLSCLARLGIYYLSKTQRYRFICDYLQVRGGPQAKALFRDIDARLSRRPPRPPKHMRNS
jgi:tRNA A-37 threonylcarbamoyl transferase component Bud32